MKIVVTTLSNAAEKANAWDQCYKLDIDGEQKLLVTDGGEPEDNRLARDLDFVYGIPKLLELAFEAGAKGEKLEIENVEVDDVEEIWNA